VLWAVLGLFARKNYHIERSLTIQAPHSVVYEHVRYFRNFPKWSPWHNYDPGMKTSIEGTDGEPGAVYRWSGNDKVGKGWQEVKSVTPERIDYDVHFQQWREAVSPTYLLLKPLGDTATEVTWAMDMHVPFPMNAFAMLTDVNAFVGEDYERGLENLRRIAQGVANKKYRGYRVREVTMPQRYYVGLRQNVAMGGVPKFYAANLPKIMTALTKQNVAAAGAPAGLFWMWNDSTQTTDMAAVVPVAEQTDVPGYTTFAVGGAKAFVIDYYGPYEKSGDAHFAMDEFLAARKFKAGQPVIEEYVTDPMQEPDSTKWLTRVIYFGN
jgi:effector-binding domain-containing protein